MGDDEHRGPPPHHHVAPPAPRKRIPATGRRPEEAREELDPARNIQRTAPLEWSSVAPAMAPQAFVPTLLLTPTPLLGRKEAVVTMTTRLERAEVRPLTLPAAGGTGKTHLALAISETVPRSSPWPPSGTLV